MSHFRPLRYWIVGYFGGLTSRAKAVDGFAARYTYGNFRVCVRRDGSTWNADHWDSGMLITGGWPTRDSAWRAAQLVLACRKTVQSRDTRAHIARMTALVTNTRRHFS